MTCTGLGFVAKALRNRWTKKHMSRCHAHTKTLKIMWITKKKWQNWSIKLTNCVIWDFAVADSAKLSTVPMLQHDRISFQTPLWMRVFTWAAYFLNKSPESFDMILNFTLCGMMSGHSERSLGNPSPSVFMFPPVILPHGHVAGSQGRLVTKCQSRSRRPFRGDVLIAQFLSK